MISTKLFAVFIGALVLLILQTSKWTKWKKNDEQWPWMCFNIKYLYIFALANAIKCWDCDSFTNKLCGDPFDNRTASLTDCSLMAEKEKQKCRKIIQTSNAKRSRQIKRNPVECNHWNLLLFCSLSNTVNGVVKYTRGCWIDDHNTSQLNEATMELCSTDACNSSSQKVPFILATLPLPILIGLYFRR